MGVGKILSPPFMTYQFSRLVIQQTLSGSYGEPNFMLGTGATAQSEAVLRELPTNRSPTNEAKYEITGRQ